MISPANLDKSKYVFTCHKTLTIEGFEQCRALPKDSVLVGCIGNVGKLGMVADDKSATNQQINALICNGSNDPHFVYYLFYHNKTLLESSAVKTTVPILNKSNFESVKFLIPPLKEQKRIASLLSAVQKAVEQQERLITLSTELKKALMHKLFTEGTRGEKQKQTEIGFVPESWEVVPLGSTGEVVYGIQAAVANNTKPVGTKIITNKNITIDGEFDLEKLSYFEIETARHRKTLLRKGDILFNWRSGSKEHVGKTAFFDLDGEWTHSSFILRIRTNDQINNRFLFNYLSWLRASQYFVKMHNYMVNAKFNKSAVNNLPTVLPEHSEQDEIADAIDVANQKIYYHRLTYTLLKELFYALLHQLMTAQIRVNDLDLTELGYESIAAGKEKVI